MRLMRCASLGSSGASSSTAAKIVTSAYNSISAPQHATMATMKLEERCSTLWEIFQLRTPLREVMLIRADFGSLPDRVVENALEDTPFPLLVEELRNVAQVKNFRLEAVRLKASMS